MDDLKVEVIIRAYQGDKMRSERAIDELKSVIIFAANSEAISVYRTGIVDIRAIAESIAVLFIRERATQILFEAIAEKLRVVQDAMTWDD